MIETKIKPIWAIFIFGSFIALGVAFGYVEYIDVKDYGYITARSQMGISLSLFFIVGGMLGLGYYLNSGVVFDDNGMTKVHKIRILFCTIFKKTTFTPWEEISCVDWRYTVQDIRKSGDNGISFELKTKRNDLWARLGIKAKDMRIYIPSSLRANYKECIEYAIQKLPVGTKVTPRAITKMRKLGVTSNGRIEKFRIIDIMDDIPTRGCS